MGHVSNPELSLILEYSACWIAQPLKDALFLKVGSKFVLSSTLNDKTKILDG